MVTKEEWYQFEIRLLCVIVGVVCGFVIGVGYGMA